MAFRSLWRHKTRSGLTVLGMVIAIAAIVGLGSISEGISGLVGEQLKFASGFIMVSEAGQAESMQSGPPGLGSRLDVSMVDEIKQMEGVADAIPEVVGVSANNHLFTIGLPLTAVEYFNLQNIDFREGDWPTEGTKEVVLGYKLAEAAGLKTGDSLQIKDDDYTVTGVLEELSSFIDLASISSYDAVAETFDMKDYASNIIVEPMDINDMSKIAAEIEETYDGVEAQTPDEMAQRAGQAIETISIFTLGIGVIASVVASIGIINTMIMAVLERRREFGIMKALGAERWVILSIVIQEAVILGIIGGFVGIALGYGMSSAVNMASAFPIAAVSTKLVLISFVYSIMLAVLASLYPAYQAVRVDAVEAMREE